MADDDGDDDNDFVVVWLPSSCTHKQNTNSEKDNWKSIKNITLARKMSESCSWFLRRIIRSNNRV